MSFFMTKLFRKKIVPVIKHDGPITELVVECVQKHLSKIPVGQSHALGFVLNSEGGSPVQCNILRTTLQLYTKKHNLPLYMFTERHALSGGYYILTAGQSIYAHESAVLGNLGVQRDWKTFKVEKDPFNLDNFAYNEQSYEYQYDILDGLKSNEEISWAKSIVNNMNSKLMIDVQKTRKLESGNWLMNKITIGDKAVELGMADGVGTYQEFLSKKHPKCKIVCHQTKSKFEAFAEKVHKRAILMKSRAFFIVIGLFATKVIIKWTLIMYFWKKSRDAKRKERQEQRKIKQQQEIEGSEQNIQQSDNKDSNINNSNNTILILKDVNKQ